MRISGKSGGNHCCLSLKDYSLFDYLKVLFCLVDILKICIFVDMLIKGNQHAY